MSEKENNYTLNAYHIDGKGVKDTPFQLLFDSNDTNLTIPTKKYPKHSKLKGIILDGKKIFKVHSIEKLHGKMKVASYSNNYSKVKLMVKSRMAGKEEAKRKKIEVDYISNLKVKADNKVIYNVNLSPCISENPLLKFSYKDINPLSLTLEYTDNNGTIKTNTIKVRQKDELKAIHKEVKLVKSAKSYPNKIESIKKLFGDIILIEDGIQVTVPKLAENRGSVPISIRSDIQFKSIALFMKNVNSSSYVFSRNCIRGDDFSLISQWFSTPYSSVDFSLRVKIRPTTEELIIVLEAKNGKFYTVKQEIQVAIGCIDAGG